MKQKLLMLMLGMLFCYFDVNAQMSGDYVVGTDTSADFTTLSDAVNQLAVQGMNGPVNLILGDSLFNEQVIIPFISGASAINILTIASSDTLPGNKAIIAYSATSNTNNYVFRLDSARYINFKDIEIQSLNPSYATCMVTDSGCMNISIDSCSFISQQQYTGNVINMNDPGSHDISISNSLIKWGGTGLNLQGFAGIILYRLYIDHNDFSDNNYIGIGAIKVDTADFSFNTFESMDSTGNYNAVHFNNAYGYDLMNNYFSMKSGTAIFSGYSGQTNRAYIANNVISINGYMDTTNDYGILIQNGNDQRIFYNTILLGDSSSKYSANIFFPSAAGYGISNTIMDNNLVNYSGGSVIKILDNDAGLVDTSDYNNLFTTGDSIVTTFDSAYTSLGSWRATTGFDQHSVSEDPMLSDTVFYVNCGSALAGAALPVSVKTDFNGAKRDTAHPDIGAFENVIPVVELGTDTLWICNGLSANLTAGDSGAFSYNWSTGSHTNKIKVITQGWYSVTVTGNHNCSASDSVYLLVNNCTSNLRSAINDDRITLQPNPFDQYLNIERTAATPAKILVFNLQGRLIYSKETGSMHIIINSSKWSSGIYLIRIIEGNRQQYFKIVRQQQL